MSTADVREMLGGISRQRVDELLRARRLIGLRETSGRWSYPLFQFDDGRPIELLVAAFWVIADAAASEWTAASWCDARPCPGRQVTSGVGAGERRLGAAAADRAAGRSAPVAVTLARFPRRTLRRGTELHRIHWGNRAPWWFSADGTGRFDPMGSGRGACYLAEQPLGAWVEVFRQRMVIDDVEVLERSLSRVQLGDDVRLADLTSRRALQFGVTASLGANEDYADSQEFAVRALEAGFGGIRYYARHDPSQKLYGIAWFGEPDVEAPPSRVRTISGPTANELVEQARARFGYRIVPRP